MKLTAEIICAGTGCTASLANSYLGIIQAACDQGQINTRSRIAAFLANVGVESDGLTASAENLNYSAQGLANTWPSRYAVNKNAIPKIPNDLANKLARQAQAIANNTYANRMGNGDEASGDGWKYRGFGWIQTTGKTNQEAVLTALGLPLSDPSILAQPVYAALSAAYYWQKNGCNELADKDMFSQTVKVVNGQLPCDANKGAVRIARYRQCLAAIGS